MKIIILGASGMLGFGLFKRLTIKTKFDVYGTVRERNKFASFFSEEEHKKLILFDALNNDNQLSRIFEKINPDYVINCIGLIHQEDKQDISVTSYINLNSLFPHKVAKECENHQAKLVHFSTDCVFSGKQGNYSETDTPDAEDYYGKSKLLGELNYSDHITIRTSIIGHELTTKHSLIDWFLSQDSIIGYGQAVFSGIPISHISDILADFVIGNNKLRGVYHLSAEPISKYALLKKVALIYQKDIKIAKDTDYVVDKSLNSSKFKKITGYSTPSWDKLIISMHKHYLENF
jgi:dTDP-4-dehydrorhamnose reductase